MKFIKITILFLLLTGYAQLQAQQNDLILQVTHDAGDLDLKWYPLQPELWEQLNATGYQIERWELNENGGIVSGSKATLAGGDLSVIQPKDSLWFVEHASEQNYYVDALGTLLYDPDFRYESDLLDATAVRYNYLVREAVYGDNIAAGALGLHLQDSSMIDGALYRYRIFATQNGQTIAEAQTDMTTESGIFVSQEMELSFDLPDGKSITEMSGRLNNVPIDFVRMTGKAYGDSIVLRWGPNHAAFWEAANEEGYLLLRMRQTDDSFDIDSLGMIKPWPKDSLSESISHDDMALVAAQVLYGEMDNPPGNMYDEASLFENRHAFALYAAERSKLAGDILGLRFVDTNVEPEAEYTYFINSPATSYAMSGHFHEIKNVYVPDPEPVDFKAAPLDSAILLTWDKVINDQDFSGYYIERSADGGRTFEKLNEQPLVYLEDDRIPLEYYTYMDSVNTNDIEFVYRLRGLTAFADIGPPAEARAQGADLLPPAPPSFYHADLMADTATFELKWRMASYPDDFAGFRVLLGGGTEGHFDTLTSLLPADSLRFTYRPSRDTEDLHFFKIQAVDVNGNAGESITRYIHYPDLVPPEPPQNAEGMIDDDGVLTIVWDHSTSNDVVGYWVYYSHHPDDVFLPVVKRPLEENIYKDTIPKVTMNEKIYYYVLAQDDNYNKSNINEILELERPDHVPPMTPIMNQPMATDSAIIISWAKSGSEDVVSYEVLKRTYGDTTSWETIATFHQDTNRVYFDYDCTFDTRYEYSVRALDDGDNYSPNAFPFAASLIYDFNKIIIKDFRVSYTEAHQSMLLEWDFEPPRTLPPSADDYAFYLYKSHGRKNVKEFTRIDKNTLQFVDDKVAPGALHNYAVMVVYNSGASSALSEVKSVLIE